MSANDSLINDDFIDRETKSSINEENLLGLIQTKSIENSEYEYFFYLSLKDIILILMIFFISFHFINYYSIFYFIFGLIYLFLLINKTDYFVDKNRFIEIRLIIISIFLLEIKIFFRIFLHKLKNNFFNEIFYDMIILISNLILIILIKKK